MHDLTMPQWAIDRVLWRQGKLHVFDDLNPCKTALIVIDLQNDFMIPECSLRPVKAAVETVPHVNRLAATVRETGGKVFWIKHTADANALKEWSHYFSMSKPELAQERIDAFTGGSRGHDLHPALDVKSEDETVLKYRFSAFIQGSSDLPARLKARDFEYVLIAGTVTNVCCESSARDAMMLNF
jgi:ureidoacrylate peracid hydrolase